MTSTNRTQSSVNNDKLKASLMEKQFELLPHLKNNIKTYSSVCEFHESIFTDYCLFCKQPICEVCVQSIHASHPVVNKASYPLSINYYERLFGEFEREVKTIEETIQPGQLLKTFKKNIEIEMNDLIDKLNDVKIKRLREIDSMFISSGYDCKQLRTAIKLTKDSINKYMNKYKNFLDLNSVKDSDSFIFLQSYEIANDCSTKIASYIKLLNQVKSTYSNISSGADNKFTEISKLIDKILLEQKKKDIQKANSKIWQALDDNGTTKESISIQNEEADTPKANSNNVSRKLMDFYQKINEDNFYNIREKIEAFDQFQDSFRNLVFDSVKRNQSLSEINKIVKTFEQKIAKKVNLGGGTRKINLNKSTLKSKSQLCSPEKPSRNSISQQHSPSKNPNSFLNDSLANKGIPQAKNSSKVNTRNLSVREEKEGETDKDIDSDEQIDVSMNYNKMMQGQKVDVKKVIERVFKPKPKVKNMRVISRANMEMKRTANKDDDKYLVNTELQKVIQENEKMVKMISNKEKVTLLIPIIRKYYSFNFLDFVRNTYSKVVHTSSKNNEKSMQELFDSHALENDPYKNCTVKVIEGTDEIQIYSKQTKKIQKIKIDFDIKKFGTKVFYKGCKAFHTQGKVYISGGKDFNGDKQLFMVYNIPENRLSRLHDMKYPRSFHSFVYQESMRALLAIGGENNNSCELYDFYLNMWNDFPELNCPRANIEMVFNQQATLAYSLFGVTGDMVKRQISDVIEVIDMIDLNKGWYKVEYINKTGIDVKANSLTIEKLPHEKLLLFGGMEQRNPQPLYLLFDMKTFEMTKIDLRQAEIMKKQEEKNENVKIVDGSTTGQLSNMGSLSYTQNLSRRLSKNYN